MSRGFPFLSGRTLGIAAAICVFGCGASAPVAAPPTSEAAGDHAELGAHDAARPLDDARSSPRAAGAMEDPAPKEPPPIPPNTAVLHVGDSFALAGFAQALAPRMKALHVRYEVRAETSSFTTTWSQKMEQVVQDTQPDLVIVNLGANEIQNTEPETHARHVRRIVQLIGDRPCVWVAPPLWNVKETGILEVIKKNSAPCRYFDTNALVKEEIPRQKDHVHPSEKGGAIWAAAFWDWLEKERAPEGAAVASGKKSPWRLRAPPPEEHTP